ncbi:hypothetical protein MMC18_006173 [Xylographa bjoerkii]|nr:hypothetical protein [Xylographa bjoerkii]
MPGALKRKASKPADSLRSQAKRTSSDRHTRSSSLASQTTLASEAHTHLSENMTKSTAFNPLDQLDSVERNKQMEIIDSLRCLGVGKDISLPQLVVVGDQSSGKSSLLEGLTALPFPVAGELCTRFATQVSLRRSSKTAQNVYTISIIPAADASDQYKQKLASYQTTLHEFDEESFSKVLQDAAVLMDLPTTTRVTQKATKRFSSDVLKIEIVGPKQPHLSVVDVPGLYHNPTKEQTASDLKTIRALIAGYIEDKRTIILAVLNSLNNLANQEVFRIAKEADPTGHRVVGIMTKLDLVQPGDEGAAIKIAQNRTERLKHGWYCVRNRSPNEIKMGVSIEQRHVLEKEFFRKSPWDQIDQRRTGIPNLTKSLATLLSAHVSREFPEIQKEIGAQHHQCRIELESLGPPRQTTQEQRQFLTKMSMLYGREVEDALNGRYYEPGDHPSKLRMLIANQADNYNDEMHENGETLKFKNSTEELVRGQSLKRDIYQEIQELWRMSRGPELPGLVNPMVLQNLFIYQSSQWQDITEKHLRVVVSLISECNDVLFEKVCPDEHIRCKIRAMVDKEMSDSITAARDELTAIIKDERQGPLITNNHYLSDNIATARQERWINSLTKMGFKHGQVHQVPINFDQMKAGAHLSNETAAIYEIHDILKAYYKVAIKRYIDNVANMVVERNLLGLNGPVRIFTPDYVASLSTENLQYIAGEDEGTSELRQDLVAQMDRLEKAKRICAGKVVGF